jgi:hypothetical protein
LLPLPVVEARLACHLVRPAKVSADQFVAGAQPC